MKRWKGASPYFTAVYLYLTLPVLIFILGWVRPLVALPAAACVLFCLYRMLRAAPEHWRCTWEAEDRERLIWIVLIVFLWVAVSGIGGFVFQNTDHDWRNSTFAMLVREDWPVVREIALDGTPVRRGFSYYIGFWMVPALVGKLLGLRAGYYCQVAWAVLGIVLFYYGVCILRRKVALWPLAVFILFSGADILGCLLLGQDLSAIPPGEHLEWWTKFQFSSHTTQLFWVFNQALPAWLVTIALYLQKNNRHMVMILSTALLCSTIPFVGMLPLCAYWMLARAYAGTRRFRPDWWRAWARDTFTPENLLGGGIMGILSYLFLKRPRLVGDAGGELLMDLGNGGWLVWGVFLAVEIGGIYWVLYRYHKRDPLYYIMLVWLCLCPLVRMYGKRNFCMRACIPALVLLCIYMIGALSRSWRERRYVHLAAVLLVLLLGAVTPVHELVRTVSETQRIYYTKDEKVRRAAFGTEAVLESDYEAVDADESWFYRYLAG